MTGRTPLLVVAIAAICFIGIKPALSLMAKALIWIVP